jgi:hypothetical protein
MCDKKIHFPSERIYSKTHEIFENEHVNIPYTGPTVPEETALMPTAIAKTHLKDGLTFETVQDFLCDRGNLIETKGKVKIGKLSSGPYETFGGTLEFKRLHFHFENLVLPLHVKYYFNKSKICDDLNSKDRIDVPENIIQKDVSGRNMGSIVATIHTDISEISFDKYYCSDGEDPTNINQLFYDLEPYFSDYSSNFGIFFDAFIDPIMDQSLFAKKIHHRLQTIYCKNSNNKGEDKGSEDKGEGNKEEKKEQSEDKGEDKGEDKLPMNIYICYQEKLVRMKEKGWMQLISKSSH